jgi:hypothetical protein
MTKRRQQPGAGCILAPASRPRSDNHFWLIGAQVLDGVGAGIFGALTVLPWLSPSSSFGCPKPPRLRARLAAKSSQRNDF